MREKDLCPLEKYLFRLEEEEIIFIKGKIFIIKPVTVADMKNINRDDLSAASNSLFGLSL